MSYLHVVVVEDTKMLKRSERGSEKIGSGTIEDNKALREKVHSNPDQYAEIPGMHHGEYHEILICFINSDWTDEEGLREKVHSCYLDSIGGWQEEVRQLDGSKTIPDKWSGFEERAIEGMIDDFFKQHNMECEFD